MNRLNQFLLVLFAVWLGLAPEASAYRDRNAETSKDGELPEHLIPKSANTGTCTLGTAGRDLDVNDVRARVFNTGSLFFGTGAEAAYVVPAASGFSPIYATGIWIGGRVGGQLRTAAATYTRFEFWPGPLNPDGTLPNPSSCAAFDRIWKVSRTDIEAYERGQAPTTDLAEWPWQLGAPVIDGDGNPNNYNLAGGDRPQLYGDQALWWVMNDVGNVHTNTQSEPIGVEVRVQAFAFERDNALGQTTFYRYNIVYRGQQPLTEAYLSVFSDPDLGNYTDDYVGTDIDLSLGYVYNANAVDNVYGIPPAAGYDFFQGPLVDGERLGQTGFMYFVNGDPARADPRFAEQMYNVMRSRWSDGTPLTAFGTGYQTAGPETRFAFPGDPVTRQFWSEENPTNGGPRNEPGDRRMVVSTGPFTINPGDQQEIVFGIVYAQGIDRLSSVAALRAADILAQNAYDLDFELPTPPPAPPLCEAGATDPALRPGSGSCLQAIELDGVAGIIWGYPAGSPGYLGNYEDRGYSFEGFKVYQYPNNTFNQNERRLVATYDKDNGLRTIINLEFDPSVGDLVPRVAAPGTDSGLRYSYTVPNAVNYQDYFLGVSAYAVNPDAPLERAIESAPRNITVRPSRINAAAGGSSVASQIGSGIPVSIASGSPNGQVSVEVVDPSRVTGDTYRVVFRQATVANPFFDASDPDNTASPDTTVTIFDIINVTRGNAVVYNGASAFVASGGQRPNAPNANVRPNDIPVIDGLRFSFIGRVPEDVAPSLVQPGCGEAEPVFGAFGPDFGRGRPLQRDTFFGLRGVGNLTAADFEGIVVRYYANDETPGTGPLRGDYNGDGNENDAAFTERRGPGNTDPCASGGAGCSQLGGERWVYANPNTVSAPNSTGAWQYWYLGAIGSEQGVGLPAYGSRTFELRWNEPSYAVRIFGDSPPGFAEVAFQIPFSIYDIGNVRPGQINDPADDVKMIVTPLSDAFLNGIGGDAQACVFGIGAIATGGRPVTDRVYAYYAVEGYDAWEQAVISTIEPNFRAGDAFTVNTANFARTSGNADVARAALDMIGAVPNPYVGYSEYETGNIERVMRFTNLPDQVTLRIFTASGTLIQTLTKDGPGRSLDWDLQTFNNLPVASGMYFVHVEAPGIGERVLKVGVINRRTRVSVF